MADLANSSISLPIGTKIEKQATERSAAKTQYTTSFDGVLFIINIDASGSDAVTVAVGTGWTLVGAGAVAAASSGHFRCRKTGVGAWTVYRVS